MAKAYKRTPEYTNQTATQDPGSSLLKATMDSSMDMIQVFEAVRDRSGDIVDFTWVLNNHASEKVYGHVIGKSLLQNNPGVVKEGIFDLFKKVVETGIPDKSEHHYVHEQFDGWFMQSTVKLNDGVATTTTDITATKRAHELTRSIIENASGRIMLLRPQRDRRGTIVDFEYLFTNSGTLKDFPKAKGTQFFQHYVEVAETGRPYHAEAHINISGFDAWTEVFAKEVDGHVLVTYLDITERKKAEREIIRLKDEIAQSATDKYHSLFNSIGEGFCIIKLLYDDKDEPFDYQFIEVNPAFLRETGLKDPVGKTGREITSIEYQWLEAHDKVLKTGEPVYIENYHKALGKWYQIHSSRMGKEGNYAIAMTLSDITERKTSEEHHAFLLTLNDTVKLLSDAHEVEALACRLLGEQLKADRVYYSVLKDDSHWTIDVEYSRGTSPSMIGSYPASAYPWKASSFIDNQGIVVDNIYISDLIPQGSVAAMESICVYAMISIPLVRNNNLILTLSVTDNIPRVWKQSEVDLVRETMERTWAAIEHAKAERALRENRERLNQLLTLMPAAVYTCDEKGHITFFNKHAAELWGREPRLFDDQDKFCGSFRMLKTDGTPLSHKDCPMADAVNNGKGGRNMEVVIEQPSGKRIVASVNIDPLFDRDGKVTGAINVFVDITRQKRAEEIMRINEERMRAMKEAYQTVAYGGDIEHSLKHLTELVTKETSGEATTAFYLSEDDEQFRGAEHTPVHWSFPIKTRENKTVGTFSMHFKEPREQSDQYVALADVVTKTAAVIISNHSDNINREKAEAALQQSEQELRDRERELSSVQSIAKVAGLDIRIAGDIDESRSWRSPEYRTLHGLLPGVEYETHKDWFNRIYPDDRERADNVLKNALTNNASSYNSEYRIVRPVDGKVRWIFTRVDIERDENGTPNRLLGAHIDVTERRHAEQLLRESEQKFRSLVESHAQAVWEADPDGEVINDSPSWRAYTGQAFDEWKGYGWVNAIHPDDRTHAEKGWREAMVQKQNFYNEFRLQTANGGYRWTQTRATPIYDENGRILKWAGMNVDIHARKEAEQLLRELNVRLQEIDEAKTDFFNNVSHEFRTPLTLLINPLEEVIASKKSVLTPEDSTRLEFSHRSAIRLQKLVNTLLDFARVEAGKLEAFYQPTDFSRLTIDLASNFRSAIEDAGLKFAVKSEPINEPIYLNHEMWEKIVSNLLSNAFKFTHKGKIEVILRNKKKNVELRVKDTGIGIPEKHIHRIFERFARVEAAHARSFEGTGIGLSLIRELVTTHGGYIKVKSEEGAGSEFIVSIPKGKDHLPKQQIFETRDNLSGNILGQPFVEEVSGWRPEDARQQKRKIKKYQREGALRVLIAEDNADMRDYLTEILSQDKYEILAFEDGHKILTFLRQGGTADLILADLMMPSVDGYELVQWLKADPKFSHIPIILLSGRSDEEAKLEGLKIGADDYIAKPFSSKELRGVVEARIKVIRKS